jgi:hypothetical protein
MPALRANIKLSITARFLNRDVLCHRPCRHGILQQLHDTGVESRTGGVMDNGKYMVKCVRNQGKETFVLAFPKLAHGRPMRTNLYETEQELRGELRWMGLADTGIEKLIRQARQTAAD